MRYKSPKQLKSGFWTDVLDLIIFMVVVHLLFEYARGALS